MVRAGLGVYKYLTALADAHTIPAPTGRFGPGPPAGDSRKESSMFARHSSLRKVVVAWILGLAIALIPLASALADGGGTFYPR
jgi:hypothetical protein